MKNKKVMLLALLLGLVALIAPTISLSATKLVVWESSGPEEDWVRKMGELYYKETGVQVEVHPVDQLAQSDKLALDGPAGKGADIVVWPHDKLGTTIEQGLLWPLPEEKLDLSKFTPSAVEAMRYQGKLYGLPYAMEALALVYNPDLLPTVPETFDELLEIAKKFNDPKKNQWGFMFDMFDFYYAYGFFGGYGAYVFKNTPNGLDPDDIGLANAGAVQAVKFLKELRDSGLIPEGTTKDVYQGLFIEGRLMAHINGPWAYAQFEEAGAKYAVAPLPKLRNGKYPQTFIGVKGYYISAFSNQKEEALKFIQWLTSKENSFKHYQDTSIIPSREDVLSMPEFQQNKTIQAFAIQATRSIPMPNIPEMREVWDPMANAITFVLRNNQKPEEVLPICVEQIKEGIAMMKR
ncbi:extracellular solute-binding protein [Capillibacterium thermochitinicola]|uniref:Maltodextrin-binding protein n=1 Tax=Capillibacterium thermochitinicola TaxID=2699427 RepID=A0A8J6LN22_9FIRM|nr:extracellular solute-binding protein [Capillibacterium thermochitinicola]